MEKAITQLLNEDHRASYKRILERLLRISAAEEADVPKLRLKYMVDDYQELSDSKKPNSKR